MTLEVVILVLLGIVAVIDLFIKKVPSIFLTGIIFVVAMVSFHDLQYGMLHLSFGILAFIFAYLLYEGKFIGGVADIKVLVIIGMMVFNIPSFFMFILFTLLFGFTWKAGFKFFMKKPSTYEAPFIPALFLVYICLLVNGGIIS